MIRDQHSDTDPEVRDAKDPVAAVEKAAAAEKAPSNEKAGVRTDPGLDEEELVRVLRALDRQSHPPPPIVDQRSCSDGGDFVAYVGGGRTAPSPANQDQHRDRILVELAALAGPTTTAEEEADELAGVRGLPRFSRRIIVGWFAAVVVAFGVVLATVVLARTRTTGAGTAAGLPASAPTAASEPVPASPPAPAPSAASASVSTSAATAQPPPKTDHAPPAVRLAPPAAPSASVENRESFFLPDRP